MDEYTKESVLYDADEANVMIEMVLSCQTDEDRYALEETFLRD